jgi:hypothetical protein
MFKCSFFKTACIAAMLGLSVSNVNAQLILQASDTVCTSSSVPVWGCINWTESEDGDPSQCKGGGWWKDTYNASNKPIQSGSFLLTHFSGSIAPYSYWGGFTTGSNGDSLCYTLNCYSGSCDNHGNCPAGCSDFDLTGSNGWVYNQWGVMAGGGIQSYYGNNVVAQKGLPYFIAYWDYYEDQHGTPSLQIDLANGSSFEPQEVYICNHPWPFYGNIYGDGFAHPINVPGGYFVLKIHSDTGAEIVDTLAVYDHAAPDNLRQSSTWHRIDLSSFGEVSNIYFTMESSDSDSLLGPNTAVYFCMDKLAVLATGKTATNAIVQKTKVSTMPKDIEVTDLFPIASYTGGEILVYDTNGKEVLKTTVKAGEKVNLSKLSKGEYRLRHGHRFIPFKKIK